jgi:Maf-like protein
MLADIPRALELTYLCVVPLLLTMSSSKTVSGTRFILGSGSASRKLILNNMNWPFIVVKPDLDEKELGDRSRHE